MHERIRAVRETLTDEKGKKYTQTRLANEMNVTRDMIATYESGRVEPSPLFISTFCKKYNVNELWLRTGQGVKEAPIEREAEIAIIVDKILKEEDSQFKQSLIKVIANLTPEQAELLKEICLEIAKENSPQ